MMHTELQLLLNLASLMAAYTATVDHDEQTTEVLASCVA